MTLQAKGISLRYDDRAILDNVELVSKPGELTGLIGPNGAGKTTLLKVLANLIKPDAGSVTLDEKSLDEWPLKSLAREMGYLAQGAPAHWPLPVKRLVELGRLPHLESWQRSNKQDLAKVDKAMQATEVKHLADRTVNTLSGGERLRVLLARILASEPRIILADEPTASLDPYHQLHTMEILREHCDGGGSGIVVMHDLNLAARFCHRLVLLNAGQVVSNGSPIDVLQPQQLATVYGIESEVTMFNNHLVVNPQSRIN